MNLIKNIEILERISKSFYSLEKADLSRRIRYDR
jgi:hypothetical protein